MQRAAALVLVSAALVACSRDGQSPDAWVERQMREYDRQLARSEAQADRFEALLEWEAQTDRYDRILDAMERSIGK